MNWTSIKLNLMKCNYSSKFSLISSLREFRNSNLISEIWEALVSILIWKSCNNSGCPSLIRGPGQRFEEIFKIPRISGSSDCHQQAIQVPMLCLRPTEKRSTGTGRMLLALMQHWFCGLCGFGDEQWWLAHRIILRRGTTFSAYSRRLSCWYLCFSQELVITAQFFNILVIFTL